MEQQAAGKDLLSLLPNPEVAFGLRTIDGTFNNLIQGQTQFGAADLTFPRLVPATFLNDADGDTFDANGPAPGGARDQYQLRLDRQRRRRGSPHHQQPGR
ncbi:peroxidase family protein [Polaromonas sp. P1-6]|nr:peroxidase family protein [Polaromonas sp. P1-6]